VSASTAIGMVGESLKALLEDEMLVNPTMNVTLLAPDETGPARRINLFLYKITENTFLKNQDWQVSRTDPGRVVPPPLSLNLHYLLTPYAQNDSETGNTNAHEILGEAMRVLHENPVLPAQHLVDGLDDAHEQIKIIPDHIDLDELSKIWSTFGQPFRLSIGYEVSVVQLDQSPDLEQDMPTRVVSVGVPSVEAPFRVPRVTAVTPDNVVAGSAITFSGENLHGRRASVIISGRQVLTAEEILADSFEVMVPADLPAGFHQIRVDISRIHRNTFFVEVTP
jgi:hypothetical protein